MSTPAPIIYHLSPSSLEQVTQLEKQVIQAETPYFFPIGFVSLLFVFYFSANLLHNFVLPRILGRKWHKDIKPEHRRTMVIYLFQILITTVALIMQVVVSPLIRLEFSLWRINLLRAAASLIAALYLFELIYRYRMTYPMIFHHAITCFAMSLALVMMERLQDPSFAITGLFWIYQATTEQTSFIALFMYRLSSPISYTKPMFRVAAVQSLIFKFASIAGTIFTWVKYQRTGHGELYRAWDALFWICTIGLAFCQVWGSWVIWKMGESLEARYNKQQQQETAVPAFTASIETPSTEIVTLTENSRANSKQWSRSNSRQWSSHYDLEKAQVSTQSLDEDRAEKA